MSETLSGRWRWQSSRRNGKVRQRALRLERLEERTLLAALPVDVAGELDSAAIYPGFVFDDSLRLGQYVADLPTAANGSAANGPLPDASEANTTLNVPKLHSSAAAAKLFLDFDGHDEAAWGTYQKVHTPAFTMDSNLKSFSNTELAAINEIWARVAEDFAPFNIDVTTVDPGSYARGRVAIIAIGGDYSDWYQQESGGVAYVAGFTGDYAGSNVGYVFSRTLGNQANWVADAASHEAGHLFGLNHQAEWSGNTLVDGYRSGNALMGVSYDAERSTWDNGTPDTSSRVTQDEMAIIAGPDNGFGLRADDYGDTPATAAALTFNGNGVTINGLIGQTNDWDIWKFTTTGGLFTFELSGAAYGGNLDGVLELWNGDSVVAADESPTTLGAKVDATLPAGTYYLLAHGKGDYGDVGTYTITGTYAAAVPKADVSVDGVPFYDESSLDFGATMTGQPVTELNILGSSEPGAFTTTVGAPLLRTFDVVNRGERDVSLSPLTVEQIPSGYSLVSNLKATTLAPGQHAYFVLRLDADAVGDFRHSLEIPLNSDPQTPPLEVNLEGMVQAPSAPQIELTLNGQPMTDGGTLNVGDVVQGAAIATDFTVANLGNVWMHLSPVNSGGTGGFSVATSVDWNALAPGETATFTVRARAAAVGALSGVAQLRSDDSDEGTFDITVTGTGTAPQRQVIDDGDAGNAFAGNWKQPMGKGYGRDIHYAAKGKGYMYSAWSFDNLASGQYRVYATWPAGNKNASNAPFGIWDNASLQALAKVNQRVVPGAPTPGGRWKLLGTVAVNSGRLVVTLTNAANGFVVADAVYIEQVSGLGSAPQIIDLGTSSTAGNSTTTLALPKAAMMTNTAPRQVSGSSDEEGDADWIAKRDSKTLFNVINSLGDEQESISVTDAEDDLAIRDKALTALAASSLTLLA